MEWFNATPTGNKKNWILVFRRSLKEVLTKFLVTLLLRNHNTRSYSWSGTPGPELKGSRHWGRNSQRCRRHWEGQSRAYPLPAAGVPFQFFALLVGAGLGFGLVPCFSFTLSFSTLRVSYRPDGGPGLPKSTDARRIDDVSTYPWQHGPSKSPTGTC